MFGHQDDSNQQAAYTAPAPDAPAPANDSSNSSYINGIAPSEPLLEAQANDGYVGATPAPSAPAVSTPAQDQPADPTPAAVGPNELLDIKQQALTQLSPLVGHLDQSPEEKFRTTMMMIQASDNQDLIHTAYELAGQIPDEKTRAQALLDVVNEINYFTQQHPSA